MSGKLIETLKTYLRDLDESRKYPGAEWELEHTLEFFAKKIHKLYVDSVHNLMR